MLAQLEFSGRIDAEYYKPSYLKYEKIIISKGVKTLKDVSNFLIGPFGSAFTVDNYVKQENYRYVRGKDVKPFRLLDDDNVYMPKEDYERLYKYALRENDVLVSVVGTIGNAALVRGKDLPAIFSCKSTVLRYKSINPSYLITYINTKYGRDLLLRKERGAIQKGLNLGDLENLNIFEPSVIFQKEIETILLYSELSTTNSKQTYTQAEEILLKEIDLQDFEPSKQAVNIKSFSKSYALTSRLDAEYYQKKYEQVIERITSQNYDKLINLVNIKKSIEPGSMYYDTEGLPFMRVADYNKYGLTEPQKYLSENFAKENEEAIKSLKPQKGTILFSKDGSVGTAYHLREKFNGITSGAILHLKVKDEKKIVPEYLTLALNSQVVKMQSERDAGGSIILHWRVSEIENVVVPIIDFTKQKEIAKLIENSFALKKESEHLLEVAKRAVEIAIETNEDEATKYIKQHVT